MSVDRQRIPDMESCSAAGVSMARRLLAVLEVVAAALIAAAFAIVALRRRRINIPNNLRGKRVVVTDGDSSFGRELVLQLLRQGCRVVRVKKSSNQDDPEFAVNENNSMLDTFVSDVREQSQVAQLAKSVKEKLNEVDILICRSIMKEVDGESHLDVIARLVNDELKTHFTLLQNFVPLMEVTNSSIVTIPSDVKDGTAFSSTRKALVDLINTLTRQLTHRNTGISVMCARLRNNDTNKANFDAAVRLVAAICRKETYCDLSSNSIQELIGSAGNFVAKYFKWRVNKQIKID